MKLRLALLAAFALLAWPSAAAPSPSMGWGQWTSGDLTFTECYLRASAALEAEGLKPENYGRFWFGASPDAVSATIVCYPLPHGTMVTISASNEGGNSGLSGDMVGRLAGRIFVKETPKPSPGTAVTPTPAPGTGTTPTSAGGTPTAPGLTPAALAAKPIELPLKEIPFTGYYVDSAAKLQTVGEFYAWSCDVVYPADLPKITSHVWGGTDGIYAGQSFPCGAALHAGVLPQIQPRPDGMYDFNRNIVIQVLPGLSSYEGFPQNGVTSQPLGGAPSSFRIIGVLGSDQDTFDKHWSWESLSFAHATAGERIRYVCPVGNAGVGVAGVIGTDVYYIGSPACLAAVHAGVITEAKGGVVTIDVRPGLACTKPTNCYTGSKRNGRESYSWLDDPRMRGRPPEPPGDNLSFVFVTGANSSVTGAKAKVAAEGAQIWTGTWATNFGTMQLIQSNGGVTGAYTHASGQISGNLAGNVLKGAWTQAPTRKGKDAGTFEFTLARDGKSFSGRWRYTGDSTWNATPWTGTCTAGPCKS